MKVFLECMMIKYLQPLQPLTFHFLKSLKLRYMDHRLVGIFSLSSASAFSLNIRNLQIM